MSGKCVSPVQRTSYLGVLWDPTTMQARMSPARIESILTSVKRVRVGHSLSSSFKNCWVWCQLRPTWYLLACCTWDPYSDGSKPWGSPRGENPLRMIKLTRQCLRALDMWRKPLVFVSRPGARSSCHHVTLATDASLTGWGAVMSDHPPRGLPDLRDRHLWCDT